MDEIQFPNTCKPWVFLGCCNLVQGQMESDALVLCMWAGSVQQRLWAENTLCLQVKTESHTRKPSSNSFTFPVNRSWGQGSLWALPERISLSLSKGHFVFPTKLVLFGILLIFLKKRTCYIRIFTTSVLSHGGFCPPLLRAQTVLNLEFVTAFIHHSQIYWPNEYFKAILNKSKCAALATCQVTC